MTESQIKTVSLAFGARACSIARSLGSHLIPLSTMAALVGNVWEWTDAGLTVDNPAASWSSGHSSSAGPERQFVLREFKGVAKTSEAEK